MCKNQESEIVLQLKIYRLRIQYFITRIQVAITSYRFKRYDVESKFEYSKFKYSKVHLISMYRHI